MPARLATADQALDLLMPRELRHLSRVHWTPVEAALRAATWLAPSPDAVVLDVGAGVGKLCLAGALAGQGTWVGVERQRALVDAANAAARLLGVSARTEFIEADALAIDWSRFSAFYFYNPFEDVTVPGARDGLRKIRARLASLRPGVRVVTFHGLGVELPAGYRLEHEEVSAGGTLAVWTQHGAPRRGDW